MSFANLKRGSSANFDKLKSELSKLNTPGNRDADDRYWKPTVDKAGNAVAVIRFLPAPDGEDLPYVRIFDHGFQGVGGWYIEKSLTTLGKDDPVGELNSTLWATGLESDKEIARKQKRRLSYTSNIYVVKDPAKPENEGKVFLYKYGKKIFEKLNDLMNPAEDPIDPKEPINPFDLWTGANFKLVQRKVEGYPNYDKSEFLAAGPLSNDDEELEAIYNKEHSLAELLDPKNFKTYEALKARLDRVLGNTATPAQKRQEVASKEKAPWDDVEDELEAKEEKKKEAPVIDADEDDSLDFFRKLAEEED